MKAQVNPKDRPALTDYQEHLKARMETVWQGSHDYVSMLHEMQQIAVHIPELALLKDCFDNRPTRGKWSGDDFESQMNAYSYDSEISSYFWSCLKLWFMQANTFWECENCKTLNPSRKHKCSHCKNSKKPWQMTPATREKYCS